MSKQKCDYCGREVDEASMSTLENGSPACVECVAEEEHGKKKEEEKEN